MYDTMPQGCCALAVRSKIGTEIVSQQSHDGTVEAQPYLLHPTCWTWCLHTATADEPMPQAFRLLITLLLHLMHFK
jgi:hypothetical protein